MKRIVLSIVFLLTIVGVWRTMEDKYMPESNVVVSDEQNTGEATPYLDEVLSVLAEANSFAVVNGGQAVTFSPGLGRKYRPGDSCFDQWFHGLAEDQKSLVDHIFKVFLETSQEYAALQKGSGYYIFSLRRIII